MGEEGWVPWSPELLDAETRQFIEQTAEDLHGLMRRTAANVIRIGEALLRVKARLPHGQFERWLHAEFAMTDRQARRLMNVAERFAAVSDSMSDFPVTVLYELASPSTPEMVVERVVAGEIDPTVAAVRVAREEARQARAEQERIQQHWWEERARAE